MTTGARRVAVWRLAKGVLLGGVAAAAFAPSPFWPLLVLAFAALFAQLAVAPTAQRAAALATVFGWGYFFVGLGWIAVALARYGGLSWPLALLAVALLALFLALYWGVAGWVVWRVWQSGRQWAVVPALAWIVAEWLRGTLFTGFPWLMPGVAAAHEEGVVNGWFPLIGALGVTGLLVGLAAAFSHGWRAGRVWGAVLTMTAVGWGLGLIAWSEPAAEPVAVTVIQTAVTQDEKWQSERWQVHRAALRQAIAAAHGTLIVTPETVLPLFADQLPPLWREELLAAAGERTLLVGLFARDGRGIHNRLASWSPPWHYDKRQLVPFGEYTPPLFRLLAEYLSLPFADQTPGEYEQPPLVVGGVAWRANICYESAFSQWITDDVAAGATVLINASNFAWYGASHGQWQHLQIGRARALETARPWVQAVNAGVSAVIGPRGETLAEASSWQSVLLEARVTPQQGLTPFVRWGGERTIAAASALLLAVLWALARKSPRESAKIARF